MVTDTMLSDHYGRIVTSLRISITKKCNLNCIYCHQEGDNGNPEREMSPGMIANIVNVAAGYGVKKVKFSGGEPLLRSDFEDIIEALPELKDISATTNGILLAKRAASLAGSGLDRVNINLPSQDEVHYQKVTGSSHALPRVIEGIYAAVDAGLTPIKLNMVLLKDINEDEIDNAVHFAAKFDGNVILQLIQLMNFKNTSQYAVDMDGVEKMLGSRASLIRERQMHRRKKYFLDGVEVELVRPIDNSSFCANCSRLRLTSGGKLKPCLMRNDNLIEIKENSTEQEIREMLEKAVEGREPYYKGRTPQCF
ncbi:MAG TPA: GTP 3',8-cyclase MoaA [Candidatus Methanoperedens sp.]